VLVGLRNGIKFITRLDPDFASAKHHLDLDTHQGIDFGTIGDGAFDMAIGLYEPLDPSVGTMQVEFLEYFRKERERSWLDTKVDTKKSTPVALKTCVEAVNFKHA